MKRPLLIFFVVGVLLLAVGGGAYVVRTRARTSAPRLSPTAHVTMPNIAAAGPAPTGAPQTTLRGDVTIDPRRQQLIGVKTVSVVRQTVDQRVRATGAVRYDETKRAVDAVVFRSPVSGFVIEKLAVKGLHVMPGQSLYKVSDISVVWVEADVYERELAAVRVGDAANVTVDAFPGERFAGRVIYIYPYLDDKTRTNKVRVQLANRGGRLKPGMYANVELTSRRRSGLVVPANAVLDSGKEHVVFVAQGDGLFQPRKVKIGRRLDDSTEILEGLKEGDRVATGASFFLDSESQLRASLQGYEASAPPAGVKAHAGPQITFRTIPDPPKTGDTQLEATVKDANGKPIDDAEVSVQFFMAAMPTMNMPAMRNGATLSPAGGGVYRGSGQLMMAGRWDATVTVTRGGERLASRPFPVVAK